MSKSICDCGRTYNSPLGVESCQASYHFQAGNMIARLENEVADIRGQNARLIMIEDASLELISALHVLFTENELVERRVGPFIQNLKDMINLDTAPDPKGS
jgi:hypothetical protein